MKSLFRFAAVFLSLTLLSSSAQAINKLYFIDGSNNIVRSDLDGTNPEAIVAAVPGSVPEGLGFDVLRSQLIWSDSGNKTIQAANLDGTGQRTVTTTISAPGQIAIDTLYSNVYWTEPATGRIMRGDISGAGIDPSTVVTNAGAPYGISVDLADRKIMWTVPGAGTGVLRQSRMDGTQIIDLQSGTPSGQAGLTFNPITSQMFWSDGPSGIIFRARSTPNAAATNIVQGTAPRGLDLNLNTSELLWADPTAGAIFKSNFNGQFVQPVRNVSGVKSVSVILDCDGASPDADGDGVPNCLDGCPADAANSISGPLNCACGALNVDADGDSVPDCLDQCPNDPLKFVPLFCGCGNPELSNPRDCLPKLTPNLEITDPPKIEVVDNDVTLTLQQFKGISLSKATLKLIERAKKKGKGKNAGGKLGLIYTVEVEPVLGKKKDRIVKTSKRNRITFKNLKAGDYNTRYKVTITRDDKPAGKTSYSPSGSFSIR